MQQDICRQNAYVEKPHQDEMRSAKPACEEFSRGTAGRMHTIRREVHTLPVSSAAGHLQEHDEKPHQDEMRSLKPACEQFSRTTVGKMHMRKSFTKMR